MSTDLEVRLESALHRIAEAHVPDDQVVFATPAPTGRPWAVITLVAAAAVIVGGLGAIVAADGDVTPAVTDARPAVSQPVAKPAIEPTMAPPDSRPVASALDTRVESDAAGRPIVVLGDGVAAVPGTVRPESERWLLENVYPTPAAAVQRSQDGTIENTVTWNRVPQSEWEKTFFDQSDVALADGRTAKWLVPTVTGGVVYAIRLADENAFTASTDLAFEDEFAAWFTSLGAEPSDVSPPPGYVATATPRGSESVAYSSIDPDVRVVTTRFSPGEDWDVATWALTAPTIDRVDVVEGSDAVIAYPLEPPDGEFGLGPSVYAKLRDEVGAILFGPDVELLTELLSSLEVTEFGDANVTVDEAASMLAQGAEITREILGEVSVGRLVITEYIDQGSSCRMLTTDFAGGTGSCEPISNNDPLTFCQASGASIFGEEVSCIDWDVAMVVPANVASTAEVRLDGTRTRHNDRAHPRRRAPHRPGAASRRDPSR